MDQQVTPPPYQRQRRAGRIMPLDPDAPANAAPAQGYQQPTAAPSAQFPQYVPQGQAGVPVHGMPVAPQPAVRQPLPRQAQPMPAAPQPVQVPQPFVRPAPQAPAPTYVPQVQTSPDPAVRRATQEASAQRYPQQPGPATPPSPGLTPTHAQPQAGNRMPRSLQQNAAHGWQTPEWQSAGYPPQPRQVVTHVDSGQRPHATAGRGFTRSDDPEKRRHSEPKKPTRAKELPPAEPAQKPTIRKIRTPSWLLTVLSLMMIGVMALVAFDFLMQAYLKTAADEKQAAHDAILKNYHVTEQADGTNRVTWQDTIEKYAGQYNLQPAFVTAVIRNESSFRTNAESSVGARGLMQMMPDTAEWVAGKLNDSYDFDNLYDAETSIRYGCWYLGYLAELFRGDPVLVSAAYHAGQGEVWGWLGDPSISPDGVTVSIDRIPISNTRTYAGRVTQAYGIYQTLLYPEDAFPAAAAAEPGNGAASAGDRASAVR